MEYHYKSANNFTAFKSLTEMISAEPWYNALNPHRRYVFDLILEELLSNIIKYAYSDAAHHVIDISILIDTDTVILRFMDDGNAFNPDECAVADMTAPLSERQVGGVGIHLVRQLSRAMSYERINGKNILTVTL